MMIKNGPIIAHLVVVIVVIIRHGVQVVQEVACPLVADCTPGAGGAEREERIRMAASNSGTGPCGESKRCKSGCWEEACVPTQANTSKSKQRRRHARVAGRISMGATSALPVPGVFDPTCLLLLVTTIDTI